MEFPMLMNDRIVAKHEARISPDDRGYVFGDGVYEVFRIYRNRLYEADAHLERLWRSARGIKLELPCDAETLLERLHKLLTASEVSEGLLYMQLTRGAAPRTHLFPAHTEPVLIAYCTPLERPLQTMQRGITAVTTEDIRWHRCDLKTLNLLPNTLAKQEAHERGAEEAIMHRSGRITECSSSNFMIVKDGIVFTHPADRWILHGVTRHTVLRLADELGVKVVEQPPSVDDLVGADEAFITGTTVEVTPIVAIDSQPVGDGRPGPVTRRLQDAFEATIRIG